LINFFINKSGPATGWLRSPKLAIKFWNYWYVKHG
jgi:hypothetical protein